MQITDEQLLQIQKRFHESLGAKVDVYHNEKHRVIGVFPHMQAPTPLNSLEIYKY